MEEGEQQWKGIETAIEDPEEARVIYCALDSFVSVVPHHFCFTFGFKPRPDPRKTGFLLVHVPGKRSNHSRLP